jgi:hypothetical protein
VLILVLLAAALILGAAAWSATWTPAPSWETATVDQGAAKMGNVALTLGLVWPAAVLGLLLFISSGEWPYPAPLVNGSAALSLLAGLACPLSVVILSLRAFLRERRRIRPLAVLSGSLGTFEILLTCALVAAVITAHAPAPIPH